MRLVILLVLVFGLAGCAVRAQRAEAFKQSMDSYVGRSADDLVVAKGPPTSTFTLSTGGKVFEYSKSAIVTSGGGSSTVMSSVYRPNPNGGVGTWVQVPTQQARPVFSQEQSCKVLVQISAQNIVESWKSEGNACY